MFDNMSNPASDMLSHVAVGVSSSACISADTGTVSPAIKHQTHHTDFELHSMRGTPTHQCDTESQSLLTN